jgi:hypothetical protein
MTISVYFKQVFTTNTKNYEIDLNWTSFEMYENLKPLIQNDFNLSSFELVKIGNEKSEYGPTFDLNNTLTLDLLLGKDIKYLAFYIRPN